MLGGSLAWTKAREDYKGLDGENSEFEFNTARRSFQVKRAEGPPECKERVDYEVAYLFVASADMGNNYLLL